MYLMISIGKLAQASNCKVATIRYYEDIGLLPEPYRTAGNQRQYRQQDLQRLRFIRHARELGFDIEAIKELLSLSASTDYGCHSADEIAIKQLQITRSKIARLQSLEKELVGMLDTCEHATDKPCQVLEVLANHELCMYHQS